MNCGKCQELLSDYLDGALGGADASALAGHLKTCAACAAARDDLQSLIISARAAREHLYEPPNQRAMWLRIRNTIETEERASAAAQERASAVGPAGGTLSRLFGRSWQFTLPQLATGAASLVVAAALLTTLGVRYAASVNDGGAGAAGRARRSEVAEANYPQTFMRPHQASLQYWQQRVEQRKAAWNPRMRASFERSVYVLDQAVNDSLDDLNRNPHDGVAEEMLGSALRDKIELLREFGE